MGGEDALLRDCAFFLGIFTFFYINKQSSLVISNNRLSLHENLFPVLTQRSTNRQQNIVEKRSNCF